MEVHSLWCGGKLSLQSILTIKSYQHYGHKFNLWTYTPELDVPLGTVLRDAKKIVSPSIIYRSTGVHTGSYAYFADYFQTQLLYQIGGIWTHTDVVLLKPFEIHEPFFFAPHIHTGVSAYFMKAPAGSTAMQEMSKRLKYLIDTEGAAVKDHHANMFRFRDVVAEYGLGYCIGDKKNWPDDSGSYCDYFRDINARPSDDKIAHHWCYCLTKNEPIVPGTFFHESLVKHDLY